MAGHNNEKLGSSDIEKKRRKEREEIKLKMMQQFKSVINWLDESLMLHVDQSS